MTRVTAPTIQPIHDVTTPDPVRGRKARLAISGVTVIVPCYNEEGVVADTLAQLEAALGATGWRYEVIVVDDGSTDDTSRSTLGTNSTCR